MCNLLVKPRNCGVGKFRGKLRVKNQVPGGASSEGSYLPRGYYSFGQIKKEIKQIGKIVTVFVLNDQVPSNYWCFCIFAATLLKKFNKVQHTLGFEPIKKYEKDMHDFEISEH